VKPASYAARLAQETVETYVRERRVPACPDDVPDELSVAAGVFVSLKKRGELRGCIGTIEPTQENAAREIIRNAISSATDDPRFPPLAAEELDAIEYSVDILSAPEPATIDDLDPQRYGVVVYTGSRKGVLLPDLEGVDTPAQQIDIARRKAGIGQREEFELARFEVKRYH
jgi:AmmeMemoRadiSam system protein A